MIFESTGFGKIQFLLHQALGSQALRQKAISNNIANVDTPGFKRSEVLFEAELIRALKSENPYPFEARRSHPKHMPFYQPKDYRAVRPKLRLEHESNYRNDKNNVDIDKEMADLAQVSLLYQAYSSALSRNFRKINLLLRG